jgi:Flp pilus assembly protein CpaB
VTTTMAPPRPGSPAPSSEGHAGFRLTSGSYRRRPWQIGLGVALVVLCGAIGATVFQSSSKRVSVVIAARNLPAGTVLTPADLTTGSLPANDKITAMSANGISVLIGQQLAVATTRGQLMVRAMVSTHPALAAGSEVVGLLLKGDQMPSVPIVVGDRVQVIAVSTPGETSAGSSSSVGTSLVASARVLAIGPASSTQTQYVADVSLEVPSTAAPKVAGYAAADQIAITLTTGSTP